METLRDIFLTSHSVEWDNVFLWNKSTLTAHVNYADNPSLVVGCDCNNFPPVENGKSIC